MWWELRIQRIQVVATEDPDSIGHVEVAIVVVPIDCVAVVEIVATVGAAVVVVATDAGLGCPKIADAAVAIVSSEPIGLEVAAATADVQEEEAAHNCSILD